VVNGNVKGVKDRVNVEERRLPACTFRQLAEKKSTDVTQNAQQSVAGKLPATAG
jgi:hypothetical protein